MNNFNKRKANFFSVLTHVAKVASSPTMFGDQWEFVGFTHNSQNFGEIGISLEFFDGSKHSEVFVTWMPVDQCFYALPPQSSPSRAQCFVDRLNGCKRDDAGNMIPREVET